MGQIRLPKPVKLILAMISSSEGLFTLALERLNYGAVDLMSPIMPFNQTSYYEPEMGLDLKRQIISFERLINPEQLSDIKLLTNSIEQEFSHNHKRRINLDPGYLSSGKLVLATTKDHQHRIYLQDGIYAEVTLRFKSKSFQPWEWTYPDYSSKEYIDIFNQIREIYMRQLRLCDI